MSSMNDRTFLVCFCFPGQQLSQQIQWIRQDVDGTDSTSLQGTHLLNLGGDVGGSEPIHIELVTDQLPDSYQSGRPARVAGVDEILMPPLKSVSIPPCL